MKKSLKQALNDQLESITLDQHQLEALKQMQIRHQQAQQTSDNRILRYIKWSMVASVGAAIVVISVLFYTRPVIYQSVDQAIQPGTINQDNQEWLQKVANEAAKNHLKKETMQIKSPQFEQVQSYLTELGFLPEDTPQLAASDGYGLAGARYCSIQGSKAAQIRYKNTNGDYITVFETPYEGKLTKHSTQLKEGMTPIVTYAKGVKVTIWVESGLLMVKTQTLSP